MRVVNARLIVWLIVAGITLQSCAVPLKNTISSTASVEPTTIRTQTPAPSTTQTPTVTTTSDILFSSERQETAWAAIPTVISATPIPLGNDDPLYLDLTQQGHTFSSGSSIQTPDGYVFSVYMVLEPTYRDRYYELEVKTPGCRLAFYRSDGAKNELVRYFLAPEYPAGTYRGFPFGCQLCDWTNPETHTFVSSIPTIEEVAGLGLSGVWSDINQNGWPEVAATYHYCPNACLNFGAVATHFYEIGPDHQITDITADLPGVMEFFQFVRSTDPPTFYVFDPSLEYYYKWGIIYTWWLFEWDEETRMFVDVSSNYPDFYESQAEEALEELDKFIASGTLKEEFILAPLFIYEKAGMSEEGYTLFMEISDLGLWEEQGDLDKCWLQVARATISEDYINGEAFKFPKFQLYGGAEPSWGLAEDMERLPDDVYDLSYCEPFRAEP